MKQPNTLAESSLAKSKLELVALFVITTIALSGAFQMHWAVSLLVAPLAMAGGILAIMFGVHTLWMLVTGAEKLGMMVGLRKTPLI